MKVEVKVGTCGFPLSRKKLYANVDVVEIQNIFYKFPRKETVEKWRKEAPQNVEFTLKASQLITHPPTSPTYRKAGLEIPDSIKDKLGFFKPTKEVFNAWEITLEYAALLHAEIIIFQTPASFKPTKENIRNMLTFFKEISRYDVITGWEPRGDWDDELLLDIFTKTEIVHVVDPFKNEPIYGEIAYFRLHGRGKGYKWRYSDEELEILMSKLLDDRPNYVLFNNTNMFEDATRFKRLLSRED
jgi:uncharacterized protein YecE (DUF72 family)